jgi:hypothetical protein
MSAPQTLMTQILRSWRWQAQLWVTDWAANYGHPRRPAGSRSVQEARNPRSYVKVVTRKGMEFL